EQMRGTYTMRFVQLYLLIFLFIIPSSNAAHIENQSVIEKLANGFQTLDLSVTEWSVTIKEEMDQKDAKQILRHLNRDYNVTKTEDANSFKYQAAYTHKATESDV